MKRLHPRTRRRLDRIRIALAGFAIAAAVLAYPSVLAALIRP